MSADSDRWLSRYVNGVRFDVLDRAAIVRRIAGSATVTAPRLIRFCATHPVVLARDDPDYRDLLNRSDLTIADGIGPALAIKLLGGPFLRTPGVEAMEETIRTTGLRHFFFGSTNQVVQKIARQVGAEAREGTLAGVEAPPFRPLTDAEWEAAADRIRTSGADVVWVGLGVPKQDFAGERLRELGAAPVICCVGAAFDFYAGNKRRAPRALRVLGLEWLYRLLQEPRRLGERYLLGNMLFVYDLLASQVAPKRKASA